MQNAKFKNRRQKGITLIALVVTITVLIILATVSINTVLGDNGIIGRAQKARDSYSNSQKSEDEQMAVLANEMAQYDEDENSGVIEKTKSYVGYYADIDGDGTVDGVIYADLAVGGSGQWSDDDTDLAVEGVKYVELAILEPDIEIPVDDGSFSYEAITGVKDYTISQANYSGDFGENGVLKATGSGKDRFYVMALSDIDTNTYGWYKNTLSSGISDYDTVTAESFGSGKTNTATMIAKWNSSAYGNQADTDMWKVIQTQVNKGWFVPSKEEWSAFASNLSIDKTNYANHNLSVDYHSSSLSGKSGAWSAFFKTGYMSNVFATDAKLYVRLSATF